MISLGRISFFRSGQHEVRVLAILHERIGIGRNWVEIQVSEMTPAVQHDPALERLSFGSNDKTIVLAPVAWVRFAPVQLKAGESQCVKGDEQVFRPLVAITPFPKTMINEKIVKNRRAEHAVLPPQLAHSRISTICQQLCFVPIHPG